MALPALRLQEENPVDAQLARLESDVEHIKVDVKDIKLAIHSLATETKAEIRRLDEKIDDVKDSLTTFALATERSFANVERSFTNVEKSIASAKLWALGLYIALAAGLLWVLARGFKWI